MCIYYLTLKYCCIIITLDATAAWYKNKQLPIENYFTKRYINTEFCY